VVSPNRAAAQPIIRPRTDLRGRQHELATLRQALSASHEGRLTVVVVHGEPGIGKSRLLDELAEDAARQEMLVLHGAAFQAEGMPPYLPLLQALGAYVATAPVERLREQFGSRIGILATLLPEILERVGTPEPACPLPPEQERFRLYEAAATFLAAIAAASPLVLVLDDLQWADAATCDLLTYISGRAQSAALLVAGAYREGEAGENPGLVRALAELNRRRLLVTIALQPLDAEASQALAMDLLGGEIAPEVARLLYRQGEGNPFFLEELVRTLVEDRTLVHREGQWRLSAHPGRTLPPRVVEAVRLRLGRLDPAVLDLLRVAAVIGRSSEPRMLSRAMGIDPEEVEDLLLAAVSAQLLRVEGDSYAFTHDMVRETLYAEVGRERRRRLHQAIGEALLTADPPRRVADLAFHFAEAGDRNRGVAYALAAGQDAMRASAAVDAMAHYRTALRLLGDGDLSRRAGALQGLGDAAMLAGDYPQAAEVYRAATAAFLQAGDTRGAAGASHRLGRALWRQEAGAAGKGAFERALELLGPEDIPEAAESLLQLADLEVAHLGRNAEGMAHSDRALAMIERLGDRRLEAHALCVAGNIRVRSNDPGAGRQALERSLALAEELDEPALAAEACAYLANVTGWTGDFARSHELSLRRLQLAERTHDPFELRHVFAWIGGLELARGRWTEAETWLARQEEALAGLQTPEPYAFLHATRGALYFYRGRFEAAEREQRAAIALVQPLGEAACVWYLGRLGLVLAETATRGEALECFLQLQSIADRLEEQVPAQLAARAYLAIGYVRLGERERAARCYAPLLPFRGQFAPVPADRALGLAAAAAGDTARARRHLAEAEARTRKEDMLPELALILLERGQLDLEGGSSRPNGMIEEGRQLSDKLGMQELGSRILAAAPVGQRGRVAGLTERELEVLRLVAEGRSNREIARTLFLSEHTVARHLTHIFTKTGVENRAGAVAFALRHNIA
jgi:DNA-binding CsgD family transcriptional regulator